jgi:hypothetical protein
MARTQFWTIRDYTPSAITRTIVHQRFRLFKSISHRLAGGKRWSRRDQLSYAKYCTMTLAAPHAFDLFPRINSGPIFPGSIPFSVLLADSRYQEFVPYDVLSAQQAPSAHYHMAQQTDSSHLIPHAHMFGRKMILPSPVDVNSKNGMETQAPWSSCPTSGLAFSLPLDNKSTESTAEDIHSSEDQDLVVQTGSRLYEAFSFSSARSFFSSLGDYFRDDCWLSPHGHSF